MDKKNTILLTVIAVATLLVAVVGASFAFFAVQENNTANVEVETTTAEAADIFTATSADGAKLAIEVTNEKMQKTATSDTEAPAELTATDSSMIVSLKAGSGKAKCTYQLAYESTGDEYTKTAGANKEYTLTAAAGEQGFAETNMDALDTVLSNTYTIENTAGSDATEQTWTFTTKFYNLTINQGVVQGADGQVTSQGQIGKTFAGNITVTNVQCSNEAVAAD